MAGGRPRLFVGPMRNPALSQSSARHSYVESQQLARGPHAQVSLCREHSTYRINITRAVGNEFTMARLRSVAKILFIVCQRYTSTSRLESPSYCYTWTLFSGILCRAIIRLKRPRARECRTCWIFSGPAIGSGYSRILCSLCRNFRWYRLRESEGASASKEYNKEGLKLHCWTISITRSTNIHS